ncbi:hypothetical protein CAC42_6262 [Sphaceloma murrayae]|uniref:Uncharacterized protein n=1 Tax=Sphaceloma murrayae TaxID=2082308 RepID=A0A2K1QTR7_9PEZI|nr:hypothetical protein CAC42_6262 [Sphaceloma murrayae]
MVLEGATSSGGDDGFSEPSNSNFDSASGDAQETSTQITEQWRIDLASLPKPIGPFGLASWDTPARIELLKRSLAESRNVIGRPFTQDEVDALAFKFAKSIAVASCAYPTGLLAGALWAYKGRETFKFPFYSPGGKEWFDPNKFSFLKGQQARAAWHGLRFTAYGGVAFLLSGFFWGSMASTTDIAGTITDPRLKDFREALKAKMREKQGDMSQTKPAQRSSVDTAEGRMDSQAAKASNIWERARQDRQRKQQRTASSDDDDMSPTGGAILDDVAPPDGADGLLSDDQLRMNERRDQYTSRAAERDSKPPPPSPQPKPRQQQAQPPQERRESAVQTGGVWERLRREAASKVADGSMSGEQRQGSTTGDSFAFSRGDEERQLAQDEAQRDFDARVERERQGGDFSEGRGRKW